MLTEFRDVTQEAKGRRRWFESSDLDLTVWYEETAEIFGFQLGYEAGGRSWALTWRREGVFSHDLVLTGDTSAFKNQTPILQTLGIAPWSDLIRRFEADSALLEEGLRKFVRQKLEEGQKSPPA